jgi:hypothetical protein
MEVFSPQPDAPVLPLAGFMPSNDPVHVRNIDGLGPVKSDIVSTQFASGRGELFQGATTGKRNIVIALGLNPDWQDQTMSSLRQLLYRYFMPEQWTKLKFFSTHLPDCEIEGYVESFEPNMFSQDPEIQISILCHKPDFIESNSTILYGTVDDGTVEVAYDYLGTVEAGLELRIDPTPTNTAYAGDITVIATAFGEEQTFTAEDIIINTTKYFKLSSIRNAKRVQNISFVDGEPTNLLAKITDESVWPVIKPGENLIKVIGSETDLAWTLAYFNRFGGL